MPRDVEPLRSIPEAVVATIPVTIPLADSGLPQLLFTFAMGLLALLGLSLAGYAVDEYARFAGLAFATFSAAMTLRYYTRRP